MTDDPDLTSLVRLLREQDVRVHQKLDQLLHLYESAPCIHPGGVVQEQRVTREVEVDLDQVYGTPHTDRPDQKTLQLQVSGTSESMSSVDEVTESEHSPQLRNRHSRASKSDAGVDQRQETAEAAAHRFATIMASDAGSDEAKAFKPVTHKRRFVARILSSWWFNSFLAAVICANVLQVVLTLEMALEGQEDHWSTVPAQALFCAIYTIEVVANLIVFPRRYAQVETILWDLFDVSVILCGWIGLMFSHSIANLIVIRVLRLVLHVPQGATRWKQDAKLVVHLLGTAWHGLLPAVLCGAAVVLTLMVLILSCVADVLNEGVAPDVEAMLRSHWGSWSRALRSMFVVVSGGRAWEEVAAGLEASNAWSYLFFLFYLAFFHYVLVFLLLCTYIMRLMKFMHAAPYLFMQEKQRNKNRFVSLLNCIFDGRNEVSYEDFCNSLYSDDGRMTKLLGLMEVTVDDADQLFYSLSGQGSRDVVLRVFIMGCIRMTEPARKVDLLMLSDAVRQPVLKHFFSMNESHYGTMEELGSRQHLKILEASEGEFSQLLTNVYLLDKFRNDEERQDFTRTVTELVKVVLQCEGGCGFIVGSYSAFKAVREDNVDFQAVDLNKRYPKGYMTERLRDVHVSDPAFVQAMREFSAHSEGDAWDPNHEAGGLPKDGYALLNIKGFRVICAARLQGLPIAPFKWNGVGTRHSAALNACWALRRFPVVVVVRSERGKIHGLYHCSGQVKAFECLREG